MRVGNARDLDLAGRVQLAVTAHIRHVYTNYDALLDSGMSWPEARTTVGPTCVAILKNWMGEDNQPELEETFQEWIDLCDDEDEEDASSMEGISDSESGSRTSRNGMKIVHEPPVGLAGSPHSRVPAHDLREDARTVKYRPLSEYVLPSIESPTRHEQGPQRPASYHAPQNSSQALLHAAPPPPAPSPPTYWGPFGASYEHSPAQNFIPSPHRLDFDRPAYRLESARIAPRDYRANVIDLTSSPISPRTLGEAGHSPRHFGAPGAPIYAVPHQGHLRRAVDIGPLRGGEGNLHDDYRRTEMQEAENAVHLSNRGIVSRFGNGAQPARPVVDGDRAQVYEAFPAHLPTSRPPMVPQTASRLPPPPNMAPEPPHPAVPRTGWVTFPTLNRQGEAVR
jgi:hypothetical protein